MKILALSGSLRPGSTNEQFLHALAVLAAPAHHVTHYEDMGNLPHFSPDLDGDTPETMPAPVYRLRTLLADADAVVICTPEYAHGMPGSLKNLLDWIVSSGEFDGKPTAALSASPSAIGGERALAWLVQTLKVLGAVIPDAATFPIPFIRSHFDADGNLNDSALIQTIHDALNALSTSAQDSEEETLDMYV